jgi:hypothetical protein
MKVHARISPSTLSQRCIEDGWMRHTCGSVEISKVQCMRVVRFPGGEEHRQHWHKSSKGANLGRAVSNSRGLQQASKGAVQRVDSVTASRSVSFWRIRLTAHTQRALQADSKFRYGALAFRRRCPWWSTSTYQTRSCSIPMKAPADYVSSLS